MLWLIGVTIHNIEYVATNAFCIFNLMYLYMARLCFLCLINAEVFSTLTSDFI